MGADTVIIYGKQQKYQQVIDRENAQHPPDHEIFNDGEVGLGIVRVFGSKKNTCDQEATEYKKEINARLPAGYNIVFQESQERY